MAEKDNENEEVESSGGKKKLIIIIVGALLLVGISIGATVMLLGGDDSEETVEVDTGPAKGDAMYVELKPFTVNLSADDSVGFLQVQIQMLSYYAEVTEQLEKHKPLIRNNLTVLFAQQQSENLRSPEGKQELQKKVHETVQGVINKYGKGGELDNVFFTNFVMQ